MIDCEITDKISSILQYNHTVAVSAQLFILVYKIKCPILAKQCKFFLVFSVTFMVYRRFLLSGAPSKLMQAKGITCKLSKQECNMC